MADITDVDSVGSTGPGSKPLTPAGSGPIVQRNQLYIWVNNNPGGNIVTFNASLNNNAHISSIIPLAPTYTTINGTSAKIDPNNPTVVNFTLLPNCAVNLWFNQIPEGVYTGIITLTNTTPGDTSTVYNDQCTDHTNNIIIITYTVG